MILCECYLPVWYLSHTLFSQVKTSENLLYDALDLIKEYCIQRENCFHEFLPSLISEGCPLAYPGCGPLSETNIVISYTEENTVYTDHAVVSSQDR